jgi:hypothetical protein
MSMDDTKKIRSNHDLNSLIENPKVLDFLVSISRVPRLSDADHLFAVETT